MSPSTSQRSRRVLLVTGSLVLFICGSGCQTFNMSEGRFAEEQAGVYKDNAAGAAVIVGGTLLDVFAPDSWRQAGECGVWLTLQRSPKSDPWFLESF